MEVVWLFFIADIADIAAETLTKSPSRFPPEDWQN
jgi:hypothetical protein